MSRVPGRFKGISRDYATYQWNSKDFNEFSHDLKNVEEFNKLSKEFTEFIMYESLKNNSNSQTRFQLAY